MLFSLMFRDFVKMTAQADEAVSEFLYGLWLIDFWLFFCILPDFLCFFYVFRKPDPFLINELVLFREFCLSLFNLNHGWLTSFFSVSIYNSALLILVLTSCILAVSSAAPKFLAVWEKSLETLRMLIINF